MKNCPKCGAEISPTTQKEMKEKSNERPVVCNCGHLLVKQKVNNAKAK